MGGVQVGACAGHPRRQAQSHSSRGGGRLLSYDRTEKPSLLTKMAPFDIFLAARKYTSKKAHFFIARDPEGG